MIKRSEKGDNSRSNSPFILQETLRQKQALERKRKRREAKRSKSIKQQALERKRKKKEAHRSNSRKESSVKKEARRSNKSKRTRAQIASERIVKDHLKHFQKKVEQLRDEFLFDMTIYANHVHNFIANDRTTEDQFASYNRKFLRCRELDAKRTQSSLLFLRNTLLDSIWYGVQATLPHLTIKLYEDLKKRIHKSRQDFNQFKFLYFDDPRESDMPPLPRLLATEQRWALYFLHCKLSETYDNEGYDLECSLPESEIESPNIETFRVSESIMRNISATDVRVLPSSSDTGTTASVSTETDLPKSQERLPNLQTSEPFVSHKQSLSSYIEPAEELPEGRLEFPKSTAKPRLRKPATDSMSESASESTPSLTSPQFHVETDDAEIFTRDMHSGLSKNVEKKILKMLSSLLSPGKKSNNEKLIDPRNSPVSNSGNIASSEAEASSPQLSSSLSIVSKMAEELEDTIEKKGKKRSCGQDNDSQPKKKTKGTDD